MTYLRHYNTVLKLSTLSSASGGMETAGLIRLTAKKV
jgi:hypothetical protein